MYPSRDHISFGIFVKKFEEAIESENFVVCRRSVISGRGKTVLSKLAKYAKFYASIGYNLLTNDYDILYVHYLSNSAPVLFLLQWLIKKPFVVNFHGGDLMNWSGLEKYTKEITRRMAKRATLVVVPSDYFKEEVVRKFGISNDKICVYPSGGVNRTLFAPNKDAVLLRSEWKLTDSFVIGLVSRIDQGKRWDVFVDAIAVLAHNNPTIKWKAIIVGNGPQVDTFCKRIKELGIEGQVLFLGEKDHRDLPMIYNLMDIFVFPTDNESLGLVGLEAMSCGIPVVAPFVGGIKSYLKDDVNGYCLGSLDKVSLANTLLKFVGLSEGDKNRLKKGALLMGEKFDSVDVTKSIAERLTLIVPNHHIHEYVGFTKATALLSIDINSSHHAVYHLFG